MGGEGGVIPCVAYFVSHKTDEYNVVEESHKRGEREHLAGEYSRKYILAYIVDSRYMGESNNSSMGVRQIQWLNTKDVR